MFKYGFSFLIVTFIVSQIHGYSDCESKDKKLGELTKLTVSNCIDNDKRCILHRNTNATMIIEFKLNEECEEIHSVVHGVILGIPIPFTLPNPDGCVDSGLTCPLEKGGPYTYTTTLPVQKKYPKVTVDVKWELQNQNNQTILCVLIPAKIQ